MSATENETQAEKKTDEVSIEVNNKPVTVPKHTTGREIKSRAKVPDTFQLFRVDGKTEHPIGDDEQVSVHEDQRFVASPSLDPS
jgi:hypothetical protein